MEVKIESSWKKFLADEFVKSYFQKLTEFVRSEYQTQTVFPPAKLIFNALDSLPVDKVKVVILGQDPYHGESQAHGLSFSVPTKPRFRLHFKIFTKSFQETLVFVDKLVI